MPETYTVTHLSGPLVNIAERFSIQRCSLCGGVLFDSREVERGNGEMPDKPWPASRFVRVELGPSSYSGRALRTAVENELPSDCCVHEI